MKVLTRAFGQEKGDFERPAGYEFARKLPVHFFKFRVEGRTVRGTVSRNISDRDM